MTNARSIHIGTNRLDTGHYKGTFATLGGCENDAETMAGVAKRAGIEDIKVIQGAAATSTNVVQALTNARTDLAPGGLLVVTFSGHGTRLPNKPPLDREFDGRDEAICLYDRLMLDDEIYHLLEPFPAGIRILLLVDSCHSGTMAMAPAAFSTVRRGGTEPVEAGGAEFGGVDPIRGGTSEAVLMRALGDAAAEATYAAHRELYDDLRRNNPAGKTLPLKASVIMISACKEWETARENGKAGLFTSTVETLISSGTVRSHLELVDAVYSRTAAYRQHPDIQFPGLANSTFERAKPFHP